MLHEFKCDRLSLYKGDPIGGDNAYTIISKFYMIHTFVRAGEDESVRDIIERSLDHLERKRMLKA